MGVRVAAYAADASRRSGSARARAPRAAALLWREIGAGRIPGCGFERRYPIDRYTIDFYCRRLELAIEIGAILRDARALRAEQRRTARLAQLGVTVLRFSDEEVIHNLDGVVGTIRRCVRLTSGRWSAGAVYARAMMTVRDRRGSKADGAQRPAGVRPTAGGQRVQPRPARMTVRRAPT